MNGTVVRRIGLATLSFLGIVIGHSAAFSVAAHNAHHRAELLRSTGHDGYVLFAAIALGLVVVALTWNRAGQGRSWTAWAVRLALLQTAGFSALELAERAFAGHPGSLATEHVFYLGLALQIIVAVAAAWLCGAARRALERAIARRGAPATRRVPVLFDLATQPARPTPAPICSGWCLRGPPIAAV